MRRFADRLGPFLCAGCKVLFYLMAAATTFAPCSHGQCNFPESSIPESLTYVFEPLIANGKLILRVTLEFRGGRGGTMELDLPSEWAGQSHLDSAVTNLRVLSRDTVMLDTARPDIKTLTFPPDHLVAISYDLVKDWQGVFEYPKQFRAILEPTFFEFTAHNALVHPALRPAEMVSVHFDWQKLPAGWTLETSFGADERCQSFTGLWHRVNDALFAGGDFRIHRIAVEDQPVVIAIRGNWSFSDEEAVTRIQKIVKVEREFWQDHDFPYYLVTLVPFEVPSGSSDGSAFTNAFWLYLPAQDTFSYGVENLLAHEAFHAWNPQKMGTMREPSESEHWFSEGFTVYYADVVLLRSGLLTLPGYIESVNGRIRDYESSPVKNVSNERVVARHRENSVNQLSYVRGPILALWLDAEIRRQSKNKFSLNSVMHALVNESPEHPALELTSQRVQRVAAKHLNRSSRQAFRSFVEEGAAIPIPDLPSNSCLKLAKDTVSLFDLGFDADVLRASRRISSVKRDSEAFKAGVRDGEEVSGMSIYWGDVNKPVRLTVQTRDGMQSIEYFPKGRPVSIP